MSRLFAKMAGVVQRASQAASILSFRSFAFAITFAFARLSLAFSFGFAFTLRISFSAFGEQQRVTSFDAFSSLSILRMQLVAPVRRMSVRYIFLFAIRGGARRERLSLIECISAPILVFRCIRILGILLIIILLVILFIKFFRILI